MSSYTLNTIGGAFLPLGDVRWELELLHSWILLPAPHTKVAQCKRQKRRRGWQATTRGNHKTKQEDSKRNSYLNNWPMGRDHSSDTFLRNYLNKKKVPKNAA